MAASLANAFAATRALCNIGNIGNIGALCVLGAGLAISPFLLACATRPSASLASPPKEWRLIPTTTVLGERRQYFVHGEKLEGAEAVSDPSVKVEPGWIKEDGKVFSLYLTVNPLGNRSPDSTVLGEKTGLRLVKVTTRDTAVTLRLRIVDER